MYKKRKKKRKHHVQEEALVTAVLLTTGKENKRNIHRKGKTYVLAFDTIF